MPERNIDPKFNIHETYNRVDIVNPYRHGSPPPTGGGDDTDYQEVLDVANANGIQLPDSTQQQADQDLIAALKSTGVYQKADVFINYGGTASTDFRRICWKRKILVDVVGSVIWSAEGIEGAGGYVNTKFKPATDGINYTLNNAGILAHLGKNVAGTNTSPKTLAGVYTGSTAGHVRFTPRQTGGGNGTGYCINGDRVVPINTIAKVGLNSLSRTSSSSITIIGNTTLIEYGVSSESPLASGEVYMLARNRMDLGTADNLSDERVKYLYIGAELTNEHSSLETILI